MRDEDISRPGTGPREESILFLPWCKVGGCCHTVDGISQLVVPGNPLPVGPTDDGMVTIPITVLLARRARAIRGVNRGPQSVEDRVPELLWSHM